MSSSIEIVMAEESDSDDSFYLNPVTGIASTNSSFDFIISSPRTICIAAQSHKEPRAEQLQYVLRQLQEQGSYKVVVVICLTKLLDEMGVWRHIDVQSFSGTNQNKLKLRRQEAINMWNHFLSTTGFRRNLLERGVSLELCVGAGFPREDVLTEAARAIQPQLLVLDRSFAGSKIEKVLQKRLDCTVALVLDSKREKILKATTQDQISGVDHDGRLQDQISAANRPELNSKNSNIGGPIPDIGRLQIGATKIQDQANFRQSPAVSSTQGDDDIDYALCICVCDSPGGAQRKFVPSSVPTRGSVVLYEDASQFT